MIILLKSYQDLINISLNSLGGIRNLIIDNSYDYFINLYKKAELSEVDHYELKEFCQKKKNNFFNISF